jgi:hypothetical protein
MKPMQWADVEFRRETPSFPAMERFTACLSRSHSGILFARLIATNLEMFDRTSIYAHGNLDNLFITLLNGPSVKAAVPELNIGSPSAKDLGFRYTVPLGMEGELTHLLLTGGPYKQFRSSIDEARTISREFVTAMLDDRLLTAIVAVTQKPWTEWFCAIAWDTTYIVYDPQSRSFWLLCITESD